MRHTLPWAGLILLAACSGGSDDKAAQGNDSAPKAEESATAKATPEASSVTLIPGEWEVTSAIGEMNIPGLPAGALPKQVMQKRVLKMCLKPEDVGKPDSSFFSGEKNPDCTYEGFTMTAGTINGTITCPSRDGTQTMKMAGRYAPESYDLRMDMASERMNMTMNVTGKRIGDCPAT